MLVLHLRVWSSFGGFPHFETVPVCVSLGFRAPSDFAIPCPGTRRGDVSMFAREEPPSPPTWTQLFSDPGKKREPFLGKTILVGQPPKKKKKGATEQLSGSLISSLNCPRDFSTKPLPAWGLRSFVANRKDAHRYPQTNKASSPCAG